MLDFASVILSVVALIVSVVASIATLFRSRNYVDDVCKVKETMQNYHHYHRKARVQRKRSMTGKADWVEYLGYINSLLVAVYPSAKFRVSLRIIQSRSMPNESVVRELACYDSDNQNGTNDLPLRIADNTEFDSILNDGREFFFVSDVNEYIKKARYINSDSHFSQRWSTSITFPIKKELLEGRIQIVGFLCITSSTKLNDTKRNGLLMKMLPEIADGLGMLLNENDLVFDD